MTTTRTTKPKPTAKRSAKPKPATTGINVAIPTALHRRLRMKAIDQGVTMTDAIAAAVEAWVR